MAKLTKSITGVPDGEIYPREIPAGEDCPASLVAYAQSEGAFDPQPEGKQTLTPALNVLEVPEVLAALAEIKREAEAAVEEARAQLSTRMAELDTRKTALDLRAADLDAREADLGARLAALEAGHEPDASAEAGQQGDEAADKTEAAKPKGRAVKADAGELKA